MDRIVLDGPVNISEGFASEAEEAAFWDNVDFSPAFLANPSPIPPELYVPVDAREEVTPEELRATRRRLRLSQTALGAELGVPQNTISRWELGLVPISHARMLRLALERLAQLHARA
ncbi:MAG: helix-turn-helix domain-containing protein [Dehalococcoidia bacterium]